MALKIVLTLFYLSAMAISLYFSWSLFRDDDNRRSGVATLQVLKLLHVRNSRVPN